LTTFGDRLSSLRTEKKMTQADLAKKLRIAKSTLSMYETNKREPSFEILSQLSDFFEVTIDYLIGKSNYQTAKELADKWNEIADQAKQGVYEQSESYSVENPKINRFFRDFKSAPEEKQDEAIRFWEFIKQQEKDRKRGDKQGEN